MVYVTPPTSPVSPTVVAEQMTVTPFAARRENGAATEADAVALSDPLVPVIVAEPFAIEVTRPVLDTVATAASDVAHVTLAPLMVAPFWSLTVADSWDVAPSEAKLRLVSERVIEVATGVGVGVDAVGLLSPPQLHNNSENTTAPNSTVLFMPLILPRPTQTRNSGRAEQCLVVQRQWPWNRGAPRYWGSSLSAKWTRPSYQKFFGERRFTGVDVPMRGDAGVTRPEAALSESTDRQRREPRKPEAIPGYA